ncbi:SDR family NAD(P)-dependent oxidoreductase [Bacillus sp. FJAT-26377]|nr:SDR family NAD(P)-dependent oxidoreductase [Bacillus sp. FJAT-26377]
MPIIEEIIQRTSKRSKGTMEDDIAVVGMACRFPDANNYNEYWNNLCKGLNSIREIPLSRWDISKYYSKEINEPHKSISKWCGLIEDIDYFDNEFFNISPREALNMDPQQRLLLEETLHCIEDSGISLEILQKKKTSVFTGVMGIDYIQEAAQPDTFVDSYSGTGNYECILSNRISHYFGLNGKSYSIDAACASSLVALHEAEKSLLNKESDYAIVAGVNLNFNKWKYTTWSKSRMLSPDGQCKPFDKDANGYVPGDGVGIVLLQRKSDAISDKNNIHGVILGSAVNHTGRTRAITVPSIKAQKNLILDAYNDANIDPRTITYVEAHGTGTSLGDPIEVEALTQAFREFTTEKQFCTIGSVKSNIGHLEAAAGMAGLFKVLLMMKFGEIPKTINIKKLNPIIDFENTPFEVAMEHKKWEVNSDTNSYRASISAFGIGGANSHIILESFLDMHENKSEEPSSVNSLFLLSAKSQKSLEEIIENWKKALLKGNFQNVNLSDICKNTLNTRANYPYRFGRVVSSKKEWHDFIMNSNSCFVKANNEDISLLIGKREWKGFYEIKALYQENDLFKTKIKEIFSFLEKDEYPKLYKGYFCEQWNDELKATYSFITAYSLIETLFEIGFAPNSISGESDGFLITLALTKVISIKDALNVIKNPNAVNEISLKRPCKTIFDPVHQVEIYPFEFSQEYLRDLLKSFNVNWEQAFIYIEKARDLFDTQFTFKRYLEEWSDSLEESKITIEELLFDNTIWNSKQQMKKRSLLLLIVIISFKKLNQKWNFTKKDILEETRIYELVDLFLDELINKKQLISLVLNNHSNFKEIAKFMNSNQSKIEQSRPYPLLKEYNKTLPYSPNWIISAKECKTRIKNNCKVFQLGRVEYTPINLLNYCESTSITELYANFLIRLWQEGIAIKWDKIYPLNSYKKISLPNYVFNRKRFWLKKKNNIKSTEDLSTKEALDLPISKRLTINDSIIRNHVIKGKNIIPGAYMIEQAILAAQSKMEVPIHSLENIIIDKPGIVHDAIDIRINIEEANHSFYIDSNGEMMCKGYFSRNTNSLIFKGLPDIYQKLNKIDIESIYDKFLYQIGYEYGKSLKLVQGIYEHQDYYIVKLNRNNFKSKNLNTYVLEGAFQSVLVVAYLRGIINEYSPVYVPYFINKLDIDHDMLDNTFVLINKKDVLKINNNIKVNLEIYDNLGRGTIKIEDLIFTKANKKTFNTSNYDLICNSHVWKESSLILNEKINEEDVAIIFTRVSPSSNKLKPFFDKYKNVIIINGGASFYYSNNYFEINYAKEEDYVDALQRISERLTNQNISIYYLCLYEDYVPLKGTNLKAFASFDSQLESFFYFIKSLSKESYRFDHKIKVAVPALNSFVIEDQDYGEGVLNSSISGMIKSVMQENSKLEISLIDFTLDHKKVISTLIKESFYDRNNTIVAYRSNKRFIPSFEKITFQNKYEHTLMKEDGTYLLVGGFGGVGKAVLTLLLNEKKCSVIIVGKSKLNSNKKVQLDKYREQGYDVTYYQADITKPGDVEKLVETIKNSHKKLNGVIHMAGILNDKFIFNKDWQTFKRTLMPKIKGSLLLNEFIQKEPLDFFIVFSSIVSIFGNSGQTDYSAANSFLDNFVNFRRKNGHIGKNVSINWPLWADVGMGMDKKVIENFEKRKLYPITYQEGIKTLKHILSNEESQIPENILILKEERKKQDSFTTDNSIENIICYLTKIIGKHLGVEESDVPTDESFFTLGFDSIMSQEVIAELNCKFDKLPPTLLFDYPTLEKLSNYLINKVDKEEVKSLGLNEPAFKERETSVRPTEIEVVQTQGNKKNLLMDYLTKIIGKHLGIEESDVPTDESFFTLGFDSIMSQEVIAELNCKFDKLPPTLLFDYPTLEKLSNYLINKVDKEEVKSLGLNEPAFKERETSVRPTEIEVVQTQGNKKNLLMDYLTKIIGKHLGVEESDVPTDESFFTLGFDSIMSQEVIAELNCKFDKLPPTLLFDYPTLEKLSNYLINKVDKEEVKLPHFNESSFEEREVLPQSTIKYKKQSTDAKRKKQSNSGYDIAIIGIDGIFPKSDNVDEYWGNLIKNRDCIEEIPQKRWDYSEYYDGNPRNKNTTYGKWGGFINDVDKFDSLFFKISPKEAEEMDPQQRLIIESTWRTMEDAGYGDVQSYKDKSIGNFVGVMWNEYSFLAAQEGHMKGKYIGPGSIYWAIPNRVSYLMNFRGPSIAVDTACSSSLTAIHLACQSILNGDCDMAVAGGVNLSIHPAKYTYLGQAGFLSIDGRSRSFGANATGYVPGEGVGTILLKPLNEAIEDNDHIYGIIKGSSINHGGKGAGFTIPDSESQAELIIKALSRANVSAEDISYLECQGTGTNLGDVIEIKGLTKAFTTYSDEKQFCPIGSVKSNIGHLEAAGGIAALIKVLLSMKYKTIPKSLHSDQKNPNIDFSKTPFYVVDENTKWETEFNKPRIAGISSFGAGGANAHLIIQEYQEGSQLISDFDERQSELIILSAKNKERLAEYVKKLHSYILNTGTESYLLKDIAHTLQTGRKPLEERIAIISKDMQDLLDKLGDIVRGDFHSKDIFRGNSKKKLKIYDKEKALSQNQKYINKLIESRNLEEIASLWVQGIDFYWRLLDKNKRCNKVSLPTYPFERKSFWISKLDNPDVPVGNIEKSNEQSLVMKYLEKESEIGQDMNKRDLRQKESNRENQSLSLLYHWLISVASDLLKVPIKEIDLDDQLSEYGFDSMSYTDFVNRINNEYCIDATPTIFFECETIRELAKNLYNEYNINKVKRLDASKNDTDLTNSTSKSVVNQESFIEVKENIHTFDEDINKCKLKNSDDHEGKIAIVGISGRFPQTDNLEDFWQGIVSQNDMISELPKDRHKWSTYKNNSSKLNDENIIWGGFINDVDKFDANFFGISPREAELMDPQQRIFMETVWKVIEDAGYKPSDLWGSNTGVFAGVSTSDYTEVLKENKITSNAHSPTGVFHSVLANRISYYFNFHGPSEPIDTACSSSLVAIHRAVEAIKNGSCNLAIAGGVNTLLSSALFDSFNKAGMLSPDGRCKTFDESANGYVRGEGSGAVLLKPLKQAINDNNHIYGVIRSTSINHGGRANSLTAPNTNAQVDLLVSAYEKANIDPHRVGYIETHGTGTSLGDPIEIEALKKAFNKLYSNYKSEYSNDKHCKLGSIKTNIGHLEAAAGIAGLLKVLFALKYKKIPGNLHFKKLNPYINLDNTPFEIAQKTEEWNSFKDSAGNELPRLAGVSSFGFGGVNAHIVVEEYNNKEDDIKESDTPQLVILSAKTEQRLKVYVEQILNYLNHFNYKQDYATLSRIAYTLQIGRESMDARLAVTVENIEELKNKLGQYCLEKSNIRETSRANISDTKYSSEALIDGPEGKEYIKLLIQNKKISKLKQLWLAGVDIDWSLMYKKPPKLISLPTYPFEKTKYWLTSTQEVSELEESSKVSLSHENTSEPIKDSSSNFLNSNTCIELGKSKNVNRNKLKLKEINTHNSEYTDNKKESQVVYNNQNLEADIQLDNNNYNATKDIKQTLRKVLANTLYIAEDKIDENKSFNELGLDSILALEFAKNITKEFKVDFKTIRIYDYPTIESLSIYLTKQATVVKQDKDKSLTIKKKEKGNLKDNIKSHEMKNMKNSDIIKKLKLLLAETLYIKETKINEKTPFDELGLDSILALEFAKNITKEFKIDFKTIRIYDYPTIERLTHYLEKYLSNPANNYRKSEGMINSSNLVDKTVQNECLPEGELDAHRSKSNEGNKSKENSKSIVLKETDMSKGYAANTVPKKYTTDNNRDIAIVGMSGKFPGADNIDEFWKNLKNNVSSITEVPKERWDIDEFYDPDPKNSNKTNSKCGGFLNNIDKFDPLFFNISPTEAELMDPQQRLFLEHSWIALENAGYSMETLNNYKCGVFVGVMNNDYNEMLLKEEKHSNHAHSMTGNSNSILASRISYLLNLKGPAIQIDTACSSSLVALHLACQSLINREADMMLAGGVTLYLTEKLFIQMSNAGMLSSEGKCKTFDQGADGFVPGEAVGVVVLKRLDDAIKNRDHIYGVIKGSSINQDGKTNGITAPSAESQKSLEVDLYTRTNIQPDTISYIEAHGTGTKLGDPIEVQALTDAFTKFTDKLQFCRIGSVKTNVGHTSAAAGVVSLIKVLLSLQHKQIPASLNFYEENEHIDFSNTPFYVNTELEKWESEGPRRAGISSFGFSGTNAHVIIEEYSHGDKNYTPIKYEKGKSNSVLIPLSARNSSQLQQHARNLMNFIDENHITSLEDMSYTLQLGRSAFEERLVILAKNVQDLKYKLNKYCQGETNNSQENIYSSESNYGLHLEKKDRENCLQIAIAERDISKLAELWVSGVDIDWQLLYKYNSSDQPNRIVLPTYPFAKESYWVKQESYGIDKNSKKLHPLIDRLDFLLSSSEKEIVFRKVIYKTDLLVRDHTVHGSSLFPGMGFLEMAIAAGRIILDNKPCEVNNLVWLKPLWIIENKHEVKIVVRKEAETLNFRIESENIHDNEVTVHVEGKIKPTNVLNFSLPVETIVDLEKIKSRCTHFADYNEVYINNGFDGVLYGDYFKCVKSLESNNQEVLGELNVSSDCERDFSKYILHPAIIDSALQCIVALTKNQDKQLTNVPYSVEKVEVLHPISSKTYSHVKRERIGENHFSVDIINENGVICAKLHNIVLRSLVDPMDEAFYIPTWIKGSVVNLKEQQYSSENKRTIVLLHTSQITEFRDALIEEYTQRGDQLICVLLGNKAKFHSQEQIELNIWNSVEVEQYLDNLDKIDCVYFLGGINNFPKLVNDNKQALRYLEDIQQNGILSLYKFVQSMKNTGFDKKAIEFKVITNSAYQVLNTDQVNPYGSSLKGFTQSLSKEFYHWKVVCLDMNLNSYNKQSLKELAQSVYKESFYKEIKDIAIRNGVRYERALKKVHLPINKESQLQFKQGGVYFIVGGAGGIGLELSSYLAKSVKAKLVLIGRSNLDFKRKQRISEIESLGGEVLYLQANIEDIDSMNEAVNKAKLRFGKIDGVIHSAIILRDKTINNMSEDDLQAVLAPKVKGSVILDQVLKNEKLDFMLFFSSAESFLCQAGQSNYAAASTFIDAYAHYIRQRVDYPVKVINWGYWGSVGIVSTEAYNSHFKEIGIHSIEPEEGMKAIERVMSQGDNVSQVAVLKGNKDSLHQQFNIAQASEEDHTEQKNTLFSSLLPGKYLTYDKTNHVSYQESIKQIKEWGQYLLLNAFRSMGVFFRGNEFYKKNELEDSLGILEKYHALFSVLLEIMKEAGFIKFVNDDEDSLIKTSSLVESQELNNQLNALEKERQRLINTFPDMSSHINLLWICVSNYQEVLTGRKHYTEVMFPKGSTSLVEGIYHGSPTVNYCNSVVSSMIEKYIQKKLHSNPESKIIILELGAGTGGTSRVVFEGVKKYSENISYVYTDISPSFIRYGEDVYKTDYPFVDFQILNCENSMEAQGIDPCSIDIVLGTNVIHATQNINETLANIKQLLKPKGQVIINEATKTQEFMSMTFGLTDGWWYYKDEENRLPFSPLLNAHLWKKVLKNNHLENIKVFGLPYEDLEQSDYCVISGENNNVSYTKSGDIINSIATKELINMALPQDQKKYRKMVRDSKESYSFEQGLYTATVEYVKGIFSKVLKIDEDILEENQTFERYGVDSLVSLQIIKKYEENFGALSSTLLFEYMTIEKLASYFINNHLDRIKEVLGYEQKKHYSQDCNIDKNRSYNLEENEMEKIDNNKGSEIIEDDIAIIGISGRYPGSENLDEFWENLKNGNNCIKEIPKDRWNWNNHKAIIDSKWGGFIDDVDKFDPLLFQMTPEDAANMDPQARLFLESAWNAFEDAGYNTTLFEKIDYQVGVFAGVMNNDYEFLSGAAYGKDVITNAYSAHWSIANRISYRFNFQGPSLAVDTACSSSLTALHLACESLKREECEMAIAGGVNLILHPVHYQRLSAMNMITSDNKCKSFGDGADGFVDGEGVGAVILKPLSKAIKDKDQIYAVIKGSAINAGGKTSGFTVPNPNAQSNLIRKVLEKSNIDPRTISYVEAHGTGTSLGDPIEIAGLTKAYKSSNEDIDYCSIGSVKSNIGHLESSAGIAGLTKILLQMKHKQLVPSLHSEVENPKIDFTNTPFYIQKKLEKWKQPILFDGNEKVTFPRRAALSSFGAGGANAHIILEEYISPKLLSGGKTDNNCSSQLIVLSAKNKTRLKLYAKRLMKFLMKEQDYSSENFSLQNLAYTLQVGREPMEERLAIVVGSIEELIKELNLYCKDGKSSKYFLNNVKKQKGNLELFVEKDKEKKSTNEHPEENGLFRTVELWLSGKNINWDILYNEQPQKISLPTYPFLKMRCWIDFDKLTKPCNKEINDIKQTTSKLNDADIKRKDVVESSRSIFTTFEKVSTETEKKLLNIISDILKTDTSELSVDQKLNLDDFDSMKLIKRLKKIYFTISPLDIFNSNTIKELAQLIDCESIIKTETPDKQDKKEIEESSEEEIINIKSNVQAVVVTIVAKMLKVSEDEIDIDTDMSEYGLNSINVMFLHHEIKEMFNKKVDPLIIVNSKTIRDLVHFLVEENIICKEDLIIL